MKVYRGAVVLLVVATAEAQDWINTDAAAKGMGNAGTAAGEGVLASYWNPAALARGRNKPFELFEAGFGAGGYAFTDLSVEGDILSEADQLADLFQGLDMSGIQTRLNSGTATTADIQNAIRIISEIPDLGRKAVGAVAQIGFGVELRFGTFGFFHRQLGHAAIDPFFDLRTVAAAALADGGFAEVFASTGVADNPVGPNATSLSAELAALGMTTDQAEMLARQAELALGDAALGNAATRQAIKDVARATIDNAGGSSTNTLFYNRSGVRISGVSMRESGVSLALPVLWPVTVGVAVKEIIAETFVARIVLKDIEDGKDLTEEIRKSFDENLKRTNRFNIDLGVGISPLPFLNFGVSARNIIPTEFEFADGTDFDLRPQFRVGASASALGLVQVGIDADLTENTTDSLEGYKSRILGGGVRFTPGLGPVGFSFSVGAFDNIASSKSGVTYTGAVGFRLGPVFIDANGQLATRKVRIETASGLNGTDELELPERASFSVSFGFDVWW